MGRTEDLDLDYEPFDRASLTRKLPNVKKQAAKPSRALYILKRMGDKSEPERMATQAEAERIVRVLCEEDSSNCFLPCFGRLINASDAESGANGEEEGLMSDSDDACVGEEEKPIGILSKHGGPCKHCGTTVVSLNGLLIDLPALDYLLVYIPLLPMTSSWASQATIL